MSRREREALHRLLHDPAARLACPRTAAALAPLLSLPAGPRALAAALDSVDAAACAVEGEAEGGLAVYQIVRPFVLAWLREAYLAAAFTEEREAT